MPFDLAFDPVILTYGANALSVSAAFFLSKGGAKLKIGRWFGISAALTWLSYGILEENYSFIVAECIFLYIYGTAVLKFNFKKAMYNRKLKATERLARNYKRKLDKKSKK